MLSEHHVSQYQAIYKSYYGKEISRQEAYDQAVKLVRFVQLLYSPETQEKVWKRVEAEGQLLKKSEEALY